MRASVSIDVEITDADALFAEAADDYRNQNSGRNTSEVEHEIADFLGTAKSPKLDQCLIQIFDRPLPPTLGALVQNSTATLVAPSFRTSSVFHLSTRHLTAEERYLIRKALYTTADTQHGEQLVAMAHAEHDNLYLKPKRTGFLVRVPYETDNQSNLSPEMRAIIAKAKEVGAWMIDFDEDEPINDSLAVFDDRDMLIFNQDSEDDEPLFWSNNDGWVDRASATIFTLEEMATTTLPSPGSSPVWVDRHDHTNTPYRIKR